jgi:hypothetical protein
MNSDYMTQSNITDQTLNLGGQDLNGRGWERFKP